MKTPELEAPGAGLPGVERRVISVFIFLLPKILSVSFVTRLFELERDLIICEVCANDDPTRQVLIPRLRGMEDSSRNWSAYMTLDQLNQVNSFFGPLIARLSRERTTEHEVKIEDVKPSPTSGPETFDAFQETCENFLKHISQKTITASKATHLHPWFGNLKARQLYFLAAIHMRVHRRQLEQIKMGQRFNHQ